MNITLILMYIPLWIATFILLSWVSKNKKDLKKVMSLLSIGPNRTNSIAQLRNSISEVYDKVENWSDKTLQNGQDLYDLDKYAKGLSKSIKNYDSDMLKRVNDLNDRLYSKVDNHEFKKTVEFLVDLIYADREVDIPEHEKFDMDEKSQVVSLRMERLAGNSFIITKDSPFAVIAEVKTKRGPRDVVIYKSDK